MDDDQQFCLRWNNHQSTLISVFDTLLENETLVDCTLAAEGKFLKAHKVVLSACSPYFATLLQEQYDKHPIFILKDVKYQELRAMMDYMYRGEVNISQDQLAALLKAAESLQIKGLSDNRTTTGNANTAPKLDTSHQQQQQHRNLNVPVGGGAGGGGVSGKIGSGYTLEQTKRARLGPNPMDAQEMSGSREGSSSPSRRRRKVRRRSIENALADVHHENSNSSANQTAIQQQSNTVVGASGLSGVSAITAAASALAAAQLPTGALAAAAAAAAVGASPTVGSSTSSSSAANVAPGTTTAAQQMTTSVTKKTDSVKGATSDAMNTENISAAGTAGVSADDQESQPQQPHTKVEKQNHKQKIAASAGGKDTSDMVIEPKSEYDDDGNEGTVEDLTLDDEEMGMDDLDHNAGTSQAGEGSSQGYVPWQHERSQDELLMATQEAQQRDPQDIYPILGSLLGVDTSPSPLTAATLASVTYKDEASAEFYGFLNANSGNGAGGSSMDAASLLERDAFMQCKHCNRYYKSYQKLQEHVRKYCLKEKKYKCVSCDYRSRRKDHVLRHAKRKHSEMYELSRDDEERLFEIRGHEEETANATTADGGDVDYEDGADYREEFVPATTLGFAFNNRDLTITAVPILQESDDDDDDYDDDGE